MKLLFRSIVLLSFGCLAQEQKHVDFIKINIEILPVFEQEEIKGKGVYKFEITEKVDSIFLDAVNMQFINVELNGKNIKYSNSGKKIGFKAPKAFGEHKLFLRYIAKPKQTVYFINAVTEDPALSDVEVTRSEVTEDTRSDGREEVASSGLSHQSPSQVWTQGQGKYTSHWLPSIDDMNDKIEFDISIKAAPQFQVIANGQLQPHDSIDDFYKYWRFDMTQPMSSYLAAFVVGDFDKKVVHSNSGVPIELYFEPKDSLKFETTYRYSKEIFDFLVEEIGVPYPWQNYKQVPVHDFLYAGMENTTCTIFSNQYVIDSTAFVDKNYINVNAHELAHQWFGNLVTEVSGEHHWLHEGFATYYAYLAEKELFGEDHFYWKLYETAKTLHNVSDNGDGEALVDPKASSLTFYEKGAWALAMLRERVGEEAYRKGVQSYLNTYAYKNVTIPDFLKEMERAFEMDLNEFRQTWLENVDFPWEEVKTYLIDKNQSIKTYFEVQKQTDSTTVFDQDRLTPLWNATPPKQFKRQFVYEYGQQIPDSTLGKILENESTEVRQAAALALPEFTNELQAMWESFLSDPSYVTQEATLFKLWEAFPEMRNSYLEQLDGVVGLPNKNVRLLWLTLALVTPDFQPENKKAFYDELNDLTRPQHNFEVRQLAFQYLFQIRAMNDTSLHNLIKACGHHVWQFKKSSRNLLRQLYGLPKEKERIDVLRQQLSDEERTLLDNTIKP